MPPKEAECKNCTARFSPSAADRKWDTLHFCSRQCAEDEEDTEPAAPKTMPKTPAPKKPATTATSKKPTAPVPYGGVSSMYL